MSKRKSHTPTKLASGFQSWSLSVNGAVPSEESPNIKRVSFDIPEDNDNSEIYENISKYKKKKLIRSLPENSVILGEISLAIKDYENINYNLDDANFVILINDTVDYLEVTLKVSVASDKKSGTFLELVLPNEKLVCLFGYLTQHQFIWVIKNVKDVLEGKLNISITTTHEKSPIFKGGNIISLFFGGSPETYVNEKTHTDKICMKEFFKELQDHQKSDLNFNKVNVQHEKLIPKLCPYQARAVQWMLFRESDDLEKQTTDWLTSVVEIYKSKCDKNLYYNKYSGILSLGLCEFPPLPKGGILADEMGLGKTVAVISLILNHSRNIETEQDNDEFLMAQLKGDDRKIIFKSSKTLNNDSEIIAKNKEDHLNAHEKLVYNKAWKGPALKRALTEWYESKLSEYSAASPSKARRMNEDKMKCICGNNSSKNKETCVQCPGCELFQHSKCVGFQDDFKYYCPSCWTNQKLVKSNGTLIIAPPSIYHQWFDEIKRHVVSDAFKNGVFMYSGVKDGFIQPSTLSSHDIVITTYATLQNEVNHAVQSDSTRTLRNEKRFLKMCSPLSKIQWWRLCLDEAQMVENDYSQVNQMANLISAVNRWSVTGTPIQKSISDLYYLVEWLGVEPFSEKSIWNNFLYIPYLNKNKIPLYSVMSKIFWRNSKEDVAEELIIPKQSVKYHFLKFTAIEQNFYMREHAVSSADFSECLRRLRLDVTRTIDSIDKTTLTKLLAPLLNLRQACSHPLAVSGNKISTKTGNMTVSELLQYLFNKTKLECEEGMRKYIAALNGLAGIFCIQEEWSEAVEYYRQVLQFTEEYKEKIQIDSLQKIHTLTNLAEVLEHHSEGIPPTLRDDSLKNDAKLLEDKYMQKAIDDLKSDENLLTELSQKVENLAEKFETSAEIWWNRLLNLLTIDGSIGELMEKIETELTTSEVENKKKVELFLSKISSGKGLEIMLRNWLGGIEDCRKKALKQLDALRKSPCDDLVYHAVDCHLRSFGIEGKKKKCQLCTCESVLLDYECSLFDVSRKVLKEEYEKVLDGAQTKGSWRSQNAEKCLRVLLNISKSKNISEPWCVKDGRTHIQMLEVMKKEFKQLRAVWMSINHQVQARDEISMCKLRLRLPFPGEPLPPKMTNLSLKEHNKVETIYIIKHHEVEPQKLKLLGDLELSKSEFKKKYGTLLYLGNLGQKENPKPEPCPVCKTVLENEWCVLQCGHSYCIDCIRIMLMRSPKPSLSCPVCREITKSCDLSFIDLSGKQDNSDINVVGDHSTKVDGIVRCLLDLKRTDPKVKVLIFSTWGVVLKILEVALSQNGVSFRRMPGHKYQVHLQQFRDPGLNVTALLLPISWGSKGLNLIEASHIFLVEPIMNPAEELQAIGRIHRIGQTKETVVHRFLVSGTVEEKIHAAVSEAKDKWGEKKVTLEDLKNLFDIRNDLVTSVAHDK